MICYLTDQDRWTFEMRARWSAMSEPIKLGHLRLFNKNNWTTLHARIIGQVPHMAVWVVDVPEVPPYFRQVLLRETPVRPSRAAR